MNVTFITGNKHKADYFQRLMGLKVLHQKVDLDELQSLNLHEIVEHKVRQAYKVVGSPVIVEDVSLEFTALNGLPGPFIKFFIENSGVEACCRLLDGFEDRSAVITCCFAYYDGKNVQYFDSRMSGVISDKPRGKNGYGFDQIFICDGYNITRAEMSAAENDLTYQTIMKPFGAVRTFLTNL